MPAATTGARTTIRRRNTSVTGKSKFCLPNVPDCNENLVNFTFSNGYGGWGGQANNGSENTVYAFNDDFTWVKGSHTFKAGGMYQLTHYNGFGRQCVSGCVGFNFTETGRGGDTNFATAGGNPFASAAARVMPTAAASIPSASSASSSATSPAMCRTTGVSAGNSP